MTKQKSQSDKDTVAGQTASVTVPPAEPVGGALSNTTGTVDNQSKNNDATGAGNNDGNDNNKQLMPDASLNNEDGAVLIVTASSSRRRIGRRFPAGEPVEIPVDELTEGQLKELMADPVLNLTSKDT